MIAKIKKIKFKISIPLSGLQQGKEFTIQVKDNANFVEALALVDKYILEHPKESIFPIYDGYIHNYLQLFWNPEENTIYDDIGIMPYAPNEEGNLIKFMPIREDMNFILYPDSEIDLQPDSGC
ncbi:MAG: hypothetical protein ACFE9C_00340 [Candidatus Hodarchaeota archaeon]